MNIMQKNAGEQGGYGVIQSWSMPEVPEGYVRVPDKLDTSAFYEYNGFATLTIEDDVVTAMEPNVEAWEAWKATLNEETTTAAVVSTEELLLEMAVDHEARICAIELGV